MNVRTSIIQAFFSHSQISEYSFKSASVVSVAFAFQLHTPFRKILRECIIMSADHFVLALSLSICLLFKMISFAWSCANTKKSIFLPCNWKKFNRTHSETYKERHISARSHTHTFASKH